MWFCWVCSLCFAHSVLNKLTYRSILQDPPWRSKSVRRSDSYDEMDMYDLYKIRLPELLHTSAEKHPVLIGVWVTNHAKCRGFVHDKLLPSWNISNIVEWYWVKVTAGEKGREMETGGLPVWSFDGPSPRRCYEGLMLGYYNPKHLSVKRELPNKRAFLSVPLEHSRKPLVTGEASWHGTVNLISLIPTVHQFRPAQTVYTRRRG